MLLAALFLLPRAHAHNDYAHSRPLLDALDNGFLSVEADIFLVDGELRVGHNPQDLKPGRTLQSLYLDPLRERVLRNHGTVYGQPGELTLLIDIKTDGERVYEKLREVLNGYRRMMTSYDGGKVTHRAVVAILSGDRPSQTVAKENRRLVFIDGRLPDLQPGGLAPNVAPLVSDDYTEVFGTIASPLPAPAHQKLVDLVGQAHTQGRRIRFWGNPDTPTCWSELYDAGVDLVNTDKLVELHAFMEGKK